MKHLFFFFPPEVFAPPLYTQVPIFTSRLIGDNLQRDLSHHPSTNISTIHICESLVWAYSGSVFPSSQVTENSD